ncbi:oligoendopeptidase F [Bacteroidota bacterium]
MNKRTPLFDSGTDSSAGRNSPRDKISSNHKWNLTDIYKSEKEWEKDFLFLEECRKKYETIEGSLNNSAQDFFNCLKFDEGVGIIFSKLFLYVFLSRDVDLNNSKYQELYDRAVLLSSKLDSASSYIRPEILQIPEKRIWDFVKSKDELGIYKHYFRNIIRTKQHTLSTDKERILACAEPALGNSYNTFNLLSNADLVFPGVKNEDGKLIEISHGVYNASLYSLDRNYRKRVYKSYYKPFVQFKNTFASLLSGNIKSSIFNSQTRNYSSSREALLDFHNIPLTVYDNLVNTVSDNLEPLHRWCSLKKRLMNLESVHPYDVYVTLFPSVKKNYTYDSAVKIVLESLKLLGDDYQSNLKKTFKNRWIDVYESKGKRSGAYSSGATYGVHPYILLNWQNQLNDVFTLAHELGHNMHSYYTISYQPYIYVSYSIFIAEITSTLNEALLLEYLIDKAKTNQEKLSLIEMKLINITSTFYRQALFATFEKSIHEIVQRGDSITPEKLCSIYGGLCKKFWGKDMVVDEEETFTWTRVPHFYYNFYVYQYATSFATSEILIENFKKEGKGAVLKYLNLLKAGSSDYPLNLLSLTDINIESSEPFLAVINKMNKLLDKMEELIKEK